MNTSSENYTKYYIVEALFKLMHIKEYHQINVTDITKKAGVGRATFYRYFKTKEDILIYYFDYNKTLFSNEQKFIPRCK
ncbi:MAG: TetR/AcrR family transcriptional regulator, partial [Anaeroplasmataceae bacterium]|nr:TetR/AcrR family transcriptional regulator [Anaeroplasmataceae bacterium]